MENDPEKVILNFCQYELSDAEKKLLAKGLNFCLALKQLIILTIQCTLNYFIDTSVTSRFCLMKTQEAALSSFRQYNKSPQQNHLQEELAALASISKNKDNVIQKSDKSNSVVIADKETYNKRMENFLSD